MERIRRLDAKIDGALSEFFSLPWLESNPEAKRHWDDSIREFIKADIGFVIVMGTASLYEPALILVIEPIRRIVSATVEAAKVRKISPSNQTFVRQPNKR